MPKGRRLKPEQIVTLLCPIDVLTVNGKTLAQACKKVGSVEQSYYRWRKIYFVVFIYLLSNCVSS